MIIKIFFLIIILCGTTILKLSSKEIKNTDLIIKICLSSFQSELTGSEKSAPEGMDIYACKCFLEKVNKGFSINSSQKICKEIALKKFMSL
tara:strand:- start:5596 stop:5868 length:273 start_codon:yes stop_codon:yes gene_type:complete